LVYWDIDTAHLLPRLLCLPDGTSRATAGRGTGRAMVELRRRRTEDRNSVPLASR
jgi:hypothetical protein